MSTMILVCPACGQLAQQLQLDEEQGAKLAAQILGQGKQAARWRIRPLLCQRCLMPHMAVWPRADDRTKVLDGLALDESGQPVANGGKKP